MKAIASSGMIEYVIGPSRSAAATVSAALGDEHAVVPGERRHLCVAGLGRAYAPVEHEERVAAAGDLVLTVAAAAGGVG